jgi:hypothetical protein
MVVSKGRAQRREGDFSAEIPCYRELTGNFVFFGMPDSGHFGWKARNSAIFQSEAPCRNREFGFVKQGIQNHGTGNTNPGNREYESREQGIRNRFFFLQKNRINRFRLDRVCTDSDRPEAVEALAAHPLPQAHPESVAGWMVR